MPRSMCDLNSFLVLRTHLQVLFCLRKFVRPTIKCARYPSIQDAFEEAWNIYHTDNPRALTDSRDRIRGLIREKTGEQTLRQAKRDNARLTEDLTSILSCFFNLSKLRLLLLLLVLDLYVPGCARTAANL